MRSVALCLILAGVGGLAACSRAQAETANLSLQGVVEHDERTLSFEVGGRVVGLPVNRGDDVTGDVVIARLDDALQAATRDVRAADVQAAAAELTLLRAGTRAEELQATQSELSALKARESTLQQDLDRQQALQRGAALAKSVVDQTAGRLEAAADRRRALSARLQALRRGARSEELAVAEARLEGARAALSVEEVRLSQHELHALMRGKVTDIHVAVGEMVAAGTPVMTVAELDHPYVDVFAPQGNAPMLRVGQSVQVKVDGLDKALPGKIEHVSHKLEFTPRFLFSEAERANLVLRMRVRVDDADHRLHAGLPAFVTP